MIDRLEMGWRVFAKVLSFAMFGIGSLMLSFGVFPACRMFPGTRDQKADRIQRAIHHSFRFFIWFMHFVRVTEKPRFENLGHLNGCAPALVIANHPTLIDVVALISCMPRVDCVVKKDLWNNFFMRGIVRSAGYMPNDGGAGIVEEGVLRIKRGRSILLFPEGTRSPRGGLGPFSRGFAQIAARAGCPMLPVTIRCDPPSLMKGEGLCEVSPRRPQWVFSFDKPMQVHEFFEPTDSPTIAARKLSAAVRRYYEKKLNLGGGD
ncbi:MAG: 1-acyl-sn-glycerol-3-phosphate acyltransferase [Elusimicrobia bacterium]|nr:1-acyl-sn-glycerol-3-phosphate acyltransferase [Elusimicrobiota bacterium]